VASRRPLADNASLPGAMLCHPCACYVTAPRHTAQQDRNGIFEKISAMMT
jgi:hypothetical protein